MRERLRCARPGFRTRCRRASRRPRGREPLGARPARAHAGRRLARSDLTYPGRPVTHFIHDYGLWFVFGIVYLESAGLWLPGETALIAAGVYASKGHLSITAVIAVATAAAIIGDNIGYWIGREGGRRLIGRYGWLKRLADRVMPQAERFFERHGGKAVFLARFFGGVRVTGAWMAGISRMPWWRFFAWNAAGGIGWAFAGGLIAYYVGKAAGDALSRYGVYAGIALALLVVLAIAGLHVWRRTA